MIAAVLSSALLATATPPVLETPAVTLVAHRGLAEGIPENTLAALRQSVARGIKVIELDVRTTSDGQLVILHDETLDRTTDCSGRLAELALARVRACDAGWPSHPGERVPTLGEALSFIKPMPGRLLLDIKHGTPIARVLQEIRAAGVEAKVILGLRRVKDVAEASAMLPNVTILAFMGEATDGQSFARAGAHIIRLWSDWVEADPALVGRTQALGPEAWIMVGRRLPAREREWRALHARMIASGARGLITDRPELIPAP